MFEIHITTSAVPQNEIPNFIAFCQSINAKPIIIELYEGEIAQQPMISKVIKSTETKSIHEGIADLEAAFKKAGYPVVRTKVEVPLDYINEGVKAFPDYKGRYFEWHGKIKFLAIQELKTIAKRFGGHLSNNSLKGEPNFRFITLRTYRHKSEFLSKIDHLKVSLKLKNYKVSKEEAEYCVFDSNKKVDAGWIDTPEITDEAYLNLLAYEGFLRRASYFDEPFILKGSILTRQYLRDRNARKTNDIDLVYGFPLDSNDDASSIFSDWVTKVTEMYADDDIQFRSFRENDFWRGIDYAMNDDFPTTNTDLYCNVNGYVLDTLALDISWNLPMEDQPVPLLYYPLEGEPFTISHTVPLSLQVSWKLHQSVVRPRVKDLVDVILLLENNELSENEVERVAYHFVKECQKDKIDPKRILHYMNGAVAGFFASRQEKISSNEDLSNDSKTNFGFEFSPWFQLSDLDRIFRTKSNYANLKELLSHFENSLLKINLFEKIGETLDKTDVS